MGEETRERIAPSTLCRRLDIGPQNYFNWAAAGMLAEGRDGCTLLEGLEFAIFATLVRRLNLQRVRKAWPKFRPELRRHLAAGTLFVIYNEAADSLGLALNYAEVGEKVAYGGRVRVFSMEEPISKIREAYGAGSGGPRRQRASEAGRKTTSTSPTSG